MTRIDAAEAIAEIINAEDNYGARVWEAGNKVRIYLKLNTGRKGWIDNGHIEFATNGTVAVNATRQSGTIESLFWQFLQTNKIDAMAPVVVASAAAPAKPGIDDEGNNWNVRDHCGDERGY
jgi:hypothetical protein